MDNCFLIEAAKVINDIVPQNVSGTATTGNWINMGLGKRLFYLITGGAWAGGTPAVTVNQAKDNAGTSSKALSFTRCFTLNTAAVSPANVNDLATEVTGLSGSQNLAAAANQGLVLEIHSQDLDLANGFNHVQLAVASPGSNADYMSAIAIVYDLAMDGKPATLPTCLG